MTLSLHSHSRQTPTTSNNSSSSSRPLASLLPHSPSTPTQAAAVAAAPRSSTAPSLDTPPSHSLQHPCRNSSSSSNNRLATRGVKVQVRIQGNSSSSKPRPPVDMRIRTEELLSLPRLPPLVKPDFPSPSKALSTHSRLMACTETSSTDLAEHSLSVGFSI